MVELNYHGRNFYIKELPKHKTSGKETFESKEQGITYARIGEHFGTERIYIKFFERY